MNELIDPVPFFYERPFVAFKQTKQAIQPAFEPEIIYRGYHLEGC